MRRVPTLVDPGHEQVLEFCSRAPVERVFLEDMALRAIGRFVGARAATTAGCRRSATPARTSCRRASGCGAFADAARAAGSRMIIGEERAVDELWAAARRADAGAARGPAGPARLHDDDAARRRATPACGRRRSPTSSGCCRRAPPRTSWSSASTRSQRDEDGFRWRMRAQIEDGRSWVWLEDDVILFKAEASAWTPAAVQIQQVWVDPRRAGRATRSAGCAT